MEKGEKAIFTVRPENVIVLDKEEPGCLKGKVMNVTYKGNMTRIDVEGIFDEVFHAAAVIIMTDLLPEKENVFSYRNRRLSYIKNNLFKSFD